MKDFLVIGCGRFGGSVALTLTKLGHNVAIMDKNERLINQFSDYMSHSVLGNATDPNNVESLGIRNYDVIIVAIGSNVEASIMITVNLKDLGAKYLVVKAQNEIHAKILERMEVDLVVFPERDMGTRFAKNITSTNVFDYIELSKEYSIMEIVSLPEWEEKTLTELNFSQRYKVNIMAIKNENKVRLTLSGKDVIKKNDILVVVGRKSDLKRLGN